MGTCTPASRKSAFAEFVRQAYAARYQLSATGFYRTPKIHWDMRSASGAGRFFTSHMARRFRKSPWILSPAKPGSCAWIFFTTPGRSLNPAIDLGQIEGGFLQGVGWLTSEELWWNAQGELQTHAPSTYKIPTARDWPRLANVKMLELGSEPRGHDLSLQGRGRAAVDAGDLGVPCHSRCVRFVRRARQSAGPDGARNP